MAPAPRTVIAGLAGALGASLAAGGALAARSRRERSRLAATAALEREARARATLALAGERRAREGDEDAAARDRFRAEVARLIDTALDPQGTLEGVVRLAVPDMAELCLIDLVDADGMLGGGVAAAVDPAAAEAVRRARAISPLDPDGPHPVAQAVRTGEAMVLATLEEDDLRQFAAGEEHLRTMIRLGYSSAIVVPLVARGRISGALSMLHLGGRRYSAADLGVAVEVAGRAAMALDNARLFEDLRAAEARQEAILAGMRQIVMAQDADGRIVFANQAAGELFGTGPDGLLGVDPLGFAPRFGLWTEHGRRARLEDFPGRRLLAGREPAPLLLRSVERATGRERWWQVRATAVRDAAGAVELAVTVADDVTEVKRAEAGQRFLASASKLIGSSLDVDTTLARVAASVCPVLADWCWVAATDEQGTLRPVTLAHPEDAPADLVAMARALPLPPEDDPRGPAAVLARGRPMLITDLAAELARMPVAGEGLAEAVAALGLGSVAGVPMVAGDRPLGVLAIARRADRPPLDARDLELAAELGRRAGLAVAHARAHATSRHIAETLQRSLLPRRLPTIPGTTLATRFRAAGEGTEVGGDFYDAFPARGGWMVVMGDVTGKGPAAAAVTALARDTMRTAAAYEDGPAAVLARLDRTLAQEGEDPPALCSAVAVLVHDHDGPDVRLTVSCAGHPRPALVRAGGGTVYAGEHGPLLGALPDASWPEHDLVLEHGDALVLYTDGVTDARGPGGRLGAERLAAVLSEVAGAGADEIATRVDGAVAAFESGPPTDDLALLVLRAGPSADAADGEPTVSRRLRDGRRREG